MGRPNFESEFKNFVNAKRITKLSCIRDISTRALAWPTLSFYLALALVLQILVSEKAGAL